jgi:hypothetical protein
VLLPRFILPIGLIISQLIWTATSCSTGLPPDPGLATDDLGIGIQLGMEPADVKAAPVPDNVEVWTITRAELNTRNPYEERPAGKDLVVALYVPAGTAGYAPDDPIAAGKISDLRCYLTAPADSRLTLLGQSASVLTKDRIIALCGTPEQITPSSDGNTHLRYVFQPERSAQLGDYNIELVSSFNLADNCFAFSIALKPRS